MRWENKTEVACNPIGLPGVFPSGPLVLGSDLRCDLITGEISYWGEDYANMSTILRGAQ